MNEHRYSKHTKAGSALLIFTFFLYALGRPTYLENGIAELSSCNEPTEAIKVWEKYKSGLAEDKIFKQVFINKINH